MNDLVGHNKPPAMSVTAGEVAQDLSRWMSEHPVIGTEIEAKEAKVFIDRASLCIKDLEDERKAQTGPLNEQVKAINEAYRGPRELLGKVADELKSRMDGFLANLEAERIAAARRAEEAARAKEHIARENEAAEHDAISRAASGELDIDIAAITERANAAFADYEAAERAAQLAERAQKVKVTGGFTRALSLKTRTLEHLVDPWAVMKVTGITPGIALEVLKAARAYKKIHGKYPAGIEIEIQRKT